MAFADALRQGWLDYKAAKGRELPQKELGVLVGAYLGAGVISENQVSRWFRGRGDWTPAEFMACCAVLGLDPWVASGVSPVSRPLPKSAPAVAESELRRRAQLARAKKGAKRTKSA